MSAIAKVLVLVALVARVASNCDNACSGHGYCMTDDVCSCYDNWGVGMSHHSGDCSERVCPYELAWVDTPDKQGSFHKYAECSGRGICDRAVGECTCFDGYEGKACARTTCPNDCSGHGTCEYIDDMPYEKVSYVTTSISAHQRWDAHAPNAGISEGKKGNQIETGSSSNYYNWDSKKIRGCVCDATFGDVDCSKRMCPYGTDILDVRNNLLASQHYQMQELIFIADDQSQTTAPANSAFSRQHHSEGIYSTGLYGQTFALTFTSRLNETFTTVPIPFDPTDLNDMVHDIQTQLLKLPNRVIDGITVAAGRFLSIASGYTNDVPTSVSGGMGPGKSGNFDLDGNSLLYTTAQLQTRNEVRVNITFTGPAVQGPQHLLKIETYECQKGCTPKLTGLRLQTRANHLQSNVTEIVLADYNSYECGRRGKCDYNTGLCACFLGYVGDNCNTLTTLV